jgi:dihydroorotate dehydrogenase
VGTALQKGYGIFEEITIGLARYLERKSLTIEELCGLSRRRS